MNLHIKNKQMYQFSLEKLVRDRWAEVAHFFGVKVHQRLMTPSEHLEALRAKLLEETQEVLATDTPQELQKELADVLEVIHTLAHVSGFTFDDVEQARTKKRATNGGFDQRIYCTFVEVQEDSPHLSYYRDNPERYPEISPN